MPELAYKRQLTLTVLATPLTTPTMDLGLSIRVSMFELRETGDWDIFLGPRNGRGWRLVEQTRANGYKAKGIPRGCH